MNIKAPGLKRPELLAPAGGLKHLQLALRYGADAVYAGVPRWSLRVRGNGFTKEDFREGIAAAHALGKKFFAVMNVIPHMRRLQDFPRALEEIAALGPDAIIMADPGLIALAHERFPQIPLHLSVQANTVNAAAVKFWSRAGIRRCILSRELSLNEISLIRSQCPDTELEVFAHGAMCIASSGRCLVSGLLAHRSANLGACNNFCRGAFKIRPPRPSEEPGESTMTGVTAPACGQNGRCGGSPTGGTGVTAAARELAAETTTKKAPGMPAGTPKEIPGKTPAGTAGTADNPLEKAAAGGVENTGTAIPALDAAATAVGAAGKGTKTLELENVLHPGEWLQLEEDQHGTYLLNSKDLCTLPLLKKLLLTGVDALKIEGRSRSPFYTAMITRAYRLAIDALCLGEEIPEESFEIVSSIPSRAYTTGLLEPRSSAEAQDYQRGSPYPGRWRLCGDIYAQDDDGKLHIRVKNRFTRNSTLLIYTPQGPLKPAPSTLRDEAGDFEIQCAPGIGYTVTLDFTPGLELATALLLSTDEPPSPSGKASRKAQALGSGTPQSSA